MEPLGCLPLGGPLRLPSAVALKSLRTSDALPAWMTIVVASWRLVDDGSHGSLLVLKPWSSGKYMAKNGEVAC
jgi:hypothetical protein